jgi:hypothetical protein
LVISFWFRLLIEPAQDRKVAPFLPPFTKR